MTERFDVIIVGNGVVGLAIAYRLKARAPEMRVAVIGPSLRSGGASPAAGAMLNAWGDLVRDQFSWPALVDRADLMIDALPLWDAFCAALSPFAPAPLKPGWGTLVLETGRGGASETETLATVIAAVEARGGAVQRHPRGRIVPDGWLDSLALISALEKALTAQGAALVADEAASLTPTADGWSVALKQGGALDAAQVVLANGPFAQRLIEPLEDVRRATPRLLYEAGAGFDVDFPDAPPVPMVARTLGRGAVGGFHIVPLSGTRSYVGATAEAALEPNWAAPAQRLATVRETFVAEYDSSFAAARFVPRALGFRALSADGFPLLGESHARGLWFATGMRRDGLTSSPVIANAMADAIIDRRLSPALQRFKPSRRLLSYKEAPQALADACAGHAQAEQERLAAIYARRDLGGFGVNPAILPFLADDAAFALLFGASGAG